ncbi:MAG: hypothetical protein ICV72_12215, partial [Aldersonia sp.]|nr:hypothetical protein [Aldersonia sp.]
SVAEVFCDVLGVERAGLDDDFFALGGNSLLATQVAARLGRTFDTTVEVRSLYDASTVCDLAELLATRVGAGAEPALVPRPKGELVPLAPNQMRFWKVNRIAPEITAHNMVTAFRLRGALDVGALQAAVADVVARHESLRTIYPEVEGFGPVQQVLAPEAAGVTLEVEQVAADRLVERAGELFRSTFDLTREVPAVLRLLECTEAKDEFVVVVAVYHIAGDGFSVGPMVRDLMLAYDARRRGVAPAWEPLEVQYTDYAVWQRERLGSEDDPSSLAAREIQYWKTALDGMPDELALPRDRPSPATWSYDMGSWVPIEVSAQRHAQLIDVARRYEVTPFMVVHAALAVLLAELSGSDDICIGTPTAGRGRPEVDDLIGMFYNNVVLRTTVDPTESVKELLAQVRRRDVDAFAHATVPIARIAELVRGPGRARPDRPFYQVSLAFHNMPASTFELPDLVMSPLNVDRAISLFELYFVLSEAHDEHGAPAGLRGVLTYSTAMYDAATATRIAARFGEILDAAVLDPTVAVATIQAAGQHRDGRSTDTGTGGEFVSHDSKRSALD